MYTPMTKIRVTYRGKSTSPGMHHYECTDPHGNIVSVGYNPYAQPWDTDCAAEARALLSDKNGGRRIGYEFVPYDATHST